LRKEKEVNHGREEDQVASGEGWKLLCEEKAFEIKEMED
jgi:hypothetical protein